MQIGIFDSSAKGQVSLILIAENEGDEEKVAFLRKKLDRNHIDAKGRVETPSDPATAIVISLDQLLA